MSPYSRCRWQVQVYVYCSWRIPAHLRCTQCSILLHLIDICLLPCILYRKSRLVCVVIGPAFVSTPPSFMRSSASHLLSPHGRLLQKKRQIGPPLLGRKVSTQFAQQFATAVTDPPLVGCAVWSLLLLFNHLICCAIISVVT